MKLAETKGGRKIFSRVLVRLRQPGESRSRGRDPIDLKVDGLGSRKDGGSRVPKRSNTDLLSALALWALNTMADRVGKGTPTAERDEKRSLLDRLGDQSRAWLTSTAFVDRAHSWPQLAYAVALALARSFRVAPKTAYSVAYGCGAAWHGSARNALRRVHRMQSHRGSARLPDASRFSGRSSSTRAPSFHDFIVFVRETIESNRVNSVNKCENWRALLIYMYAIYIDDASHELLRSIAPSSDSFLDFAFDGIVLRA